MGKLEQKVVLITGGARGQGRSHALAMAEEGADVAVCDIAAQVPGIPYPMGTADQLRETVQLVEKLGRRSVGIEADLRDTTQVQAVVDQVIADFGRIDVLLVNHGVVAYGPIDELTDEGWSAVVDTNLTAAFKVMRAVVPYMKKERYGRIVVTASEAGRMGKANLAHYVSSKWGIIGLVKACSRDVAQWGITVNVVCPSAVNTELFHNQPTYDVFCPDIENPTREDLERRLGEIGHILNGRRYLEPEHVTRAVMYFATDDGVMTGQVMDVGLGFSAMNVA